MTDKYLMKYLGLILKTISFPQTKPGDSCINQLLSITREIYKSFDEGFQVRGVFRDISKAFEKNYLAQGYYFQTKTKWHFW